MSLVKALPRSLKTLAWGKLPKYFTPCITLGILLPLQIPWKNLFICLTLAMNVIFYHLIHLFLLNISSDLGSHSGTNIDLSLPSSEILFLFVAKLGLTPRPGLNLPNTDGSTPMATPLRDKLSINEDEDMGAGGFQVVFNPIIFFLRQADLSTFYVLTVYFR